MQIIQTIRDKGAAVVIAVIALSLIGFLLMDAKSGSNNFFGSLSSSLGKVNGEAIERAEFEAKFKQADAVAANQAQQYGQKPEAGQIRQQVWDNIVGQRIFSAEAKKLGIDFTSKELNRLFFSNDPSNPFLQGGGFTDPASGQLDASKVSQKIAEMKKAKGEEADNYDQIAEQIKVQNIFGKYNALLTASAYYPSWMQEKDKAENKNFANISFVAIPYSVISDSTVKVTDDEINSYIQKHKNQFKQEEGRIISYVSFSQLPSGDDSAKTKGIVTDLKPQFEADTNAAAFLARNASLVPLNEDYIWKSKYQSSAKDTITSLPKGGVYGPYIEGNNFVLAKMVDIKQQPDSVFCRHILIKIADLKNGQVSNQIRPDSTAKRLIDSIANAAKNGADFNELVLKYSEDGGSKTTKGEYHFNSDNRLVDSFYRTVFYEPVGTKKVVLGVDNENYVGYHYIEVLNQFKFEPAYKVAYMVKEILSSEATIQNANNNATRLSGVKSGKDFESYVAKNGLQKVNWPTIVKENDFQLGQLQDARQLVKWAFEAKKGDVSEPFNLDNQFVVATVDKIQEKGTQDAATARPMVEGIIRNQKRAEVIIKNLGANPTFEAAAAKYNQQVQVAGADSSLTFSSQIIANVGPEPKVIGASFDKQNQTKISAPIEGSTAVYLIKVNSIGSKPADSPEIEEQQKKQQKTTLVTQASSGWFEGLKNQATIKDNRSKFY
jgi:peptidyl-prolyl cis-trans isomerase D